MTYPNGGPFGPPPAATIDAGRYNYRQALCKAGTRRHYMPDSREYKRGLRYGPWYPCTLPIEHDGDHVWSIEPEIEPAADLDAWRAERPADSTTGQGWWVDIREALFYALDDQGDQARHISCKVDPRPFAVPVGITGTTLEAFLIAVVRHRNKCHGGRSE